MPISVDFRRLSCACGGCFLFEVFLLLGFLLRVDPLECFDPFCVKNGIYTLQILAKSSYEKNTPLEDTAICSKKGGEGQYARCGVKIEERLPTFYMVGEGRPQEEGGAHKLGWSADIGL